MNEDNNATTQRPASKVPMQQQHRDPPEVEAERQRQAALRHDQ